MNDDIRKLDPKRVWNYFADICAQPRPSKNERKIVDYILRFGEARSLETKLDKVNNILIYKPATKGMEQLKTVVLQSHMDMVCEKNTDTVHDFEKDPIQTHIEDEWIKAKGTTLGADDGIGVATQLALLESTDIPHGPIECLFTVDEETGLTGAFNLQPGFVKGKILLNLDSEDEGELFIGCAGGKDTTASFTYKLEDVTKDFLTYKLIVKGLKGGHSGDDINKGLGNAVKILSQILLELSLKCKVRLALIDAGNLRNAIAREGYALIALPSANVDEMNEMLKGKINEFKKDFAITDPGLSISLEAHDKANKCIDLTTQQQLLASLNECPHGMIAMSPSIPNLVETSTNLASVKMKEDKIIVATSQRSSVESAKKELCDRVASIFKKADASVIHSDGYPGWTPNLNSEILQITKQAYARLFNKEPNVLAIHAGLECGVIGEKYPGMDMISYGPTIKGAHSPDERLKIETVKSFWNLTLEILKNIPKK